MKEKVNELEKIFLKYKYSTEDLTIDCILKESKLIKNEEDFYNVYEEYIAKEIQEDFRERNGYYSYEF